MPRLSLLALGGLALTLSLAFAASPAERRDYAAVALNVLPPGQNGSLEFDRHTADQAKLYDCLTPLFDKVRASDLRRCFKSARLGLEGKASRTERPRRGVLVQRDRWGVPHITGKTQADVAFGAGWVTAEDRAILIELLRKAGRLSAIDAPGFNAFAVALSGREFVPSAQTEAFLDAQVALLRSSGAAGRRAVAYVNAFSAGVNAYFKATRLPVAPFRPRDVVAIATVLAARFAADGGDELRRSQFLAELQQRLGPAKGREVFDDLSELEDPDAPVTAPGTFPYGERALNPTGSVTIAPGSFTPAIKSAASGSFGRRTMSNAILVGAKRSRTGHPLFVAGPQLGYFFPEVFVELDLHGGGIDVRGGAVPGVPYVVIGRGPDSVWSATSPQSDNIDLFAETLCGDDVHYLHKGQCREMTTFDAGVLRGGPADQPVVFRETVHGPVLGYATTTEGRRVAISQGRATRGREALSLLALQDLNEGRVGSARDFIRSMGKFELTLNWFYADDRDIAYYSSGRLPLRASGIDPSLPTIGTGEYDWRGFLPNSAHPQALNPPSDTIVNWNNKQARGFAAADTNWTYGSVQRVELLTASLGSSGKLSLAQVVAAANKAATQDLRVMRVWPIIAAVLRTGPPPTATGQVLLDRLDAWRANGGSRLDRDLDGKIDDPGAAIMDAAWPRLARAVLSPVLGSLVDRLAALHPISDNADSSGSAYGYGWYGYVDKDLRVLLGRQVKEPFKVRYCGAGDLDTCRASLWSVLEAAGAELAAKQGADLAAWRADATAERINFATGIIDATMRWTNRPTFHQVMSFSGHRPR